MADASRNVPQTYLLRQLAAWSRLIDAHGDDVTNAGIAGDGSPPRSRRCLCGAEILDCEILDGGTATVDAPPDPAGQWLPARVVGGVVSLAPWEEKLDGIDVVRLRTHNCAEARP